MPDPLMATSSKQLGPLGFPAGSGQEVMSSVSPDSSLSHKHHTHSGRHVNSEGNVKIPSKMDCPFDPLTQRFLCPICGASYQTHASVSLHIKFKHQKRFRVHCEICGKGFQRPSHLPGHMAVHGLAMRFQCSVCGSNYAHKTSLHAHEKAAHGIINV